MHVLVIGGGVIGAACAHYLVKAGHRVTIVDRAGFGAACSHGNCGYICPSHVLPLTAPGAMKKALASMFKKKAPFYVKPRLDWSLLTWLLKFAQRCNTRDMLAAGHAIQAMLNSARTLYDELVETENLACEFQRKGLLFVFKTEHSFHHYEGVNKLLAEQFQMPATKYGADDLLKREPALLPGNAGGWHYEGDAHLRPDVLMKSWRKLLLERGVTIVENCDVKGFSAKGNAVVTSQGEMAADQFVVATGAMTPFLNKELGCKIPIQPGKGYSLTMPRPATCPTIPLIFEEHSVAITPFETGYRIGSTMEFSGYDTSINRDRLQYLRESAALYLKEPEAEPIQEQWYGWRPMTYDSMPIIDRSPRFANVWIAAGHNMLGLSMAPATGKLVAELIAGGKTHIEANPYSLSRF